MPGRMDRPVSVNRLSAVRAMERERRNSGGTGDVAGLGGVSVAGSDVSSKAAVSIVPNPAAGAATRAAANDADAAELGAAMRELATRPAKRTPSATGPRKSRQVSPVVKRMAASAARAAPSTIAELGNGSSGSSEGSDEVEAPASVADGARAKFAGQTGDRDIASTAATNRSFASRASSQRVTMPLSATTASADPASPRVFANPLQQIVATTAAPVVTEKLSPNSTPRADETAPAVPLSSATTTRPSLASIPKGTVQAQVMQVELATRSPGTTSPLVTDDSTIGVADGGSIDVPARPSPSAKLKVPIRGRATGLRRAQSSRRGLSADRRKRLAAGFSREASADSSPHGAAFSNPLQSIVHQSQLASPGRNSLAVAGNVVTGVIPFPSPSRSKPIGPEEEDDDDDAGTIAQIMAKLLQAALHGCRSRRLFSW